ncbi:MAG: hypothetical protein JXL80_15320 [Planctomycetes bacterium]|nr:hypothetical protein [Planctomycetota bacterium]
MKRMAGLILVVAALGSGFASGQDAEPLKPLVSEVTRQGEESPQPSQPTTPATSAPTPSPAGRSDLLIDREKQRLTIPGTITGTTGLIEFGATSNPRRKFLAAIMVKIPPSRIVEAMRALGAEPGKVPEADPAAQTATEPEGRKVAITVHWDTQVGDETMHRQVPLEQLFWDRMRDEPLPESPWTYAGSSTVRSADSGGEVFVGDLSGSVATISLMDTSAVFYYGGNLSPGSSRHANPNLRVSAGTPCRLEVRILPQEPPKEDRLQPQKSEPAVEEAPAEETPAETTAPAVESPAVAADADSREEKPAEAPSPSDDQPPAQEEVPAAAPPAAE